MKIIKFVFISLMMISISLTGCAKWKPSWDKAIIDEHQADVSDLLKMADEIYASADTRPKVLKAISLYEKALEKDPDNYHALTSIGHLYILQAAGYTQKASKKEKLYNKAILHNEWAMYTNPDFQKKVDQGVTPWEAASVLTEREKEAMFFWITGILYKFKECMSLPGQFLNIKMIQWIGPLLKQLETIDASWAGGGVQFSLSLYYGILPESMGGSQTLSKDYLNKSIEVGPDWLLNRWGRAKYFHVSRKNAEGFKDDMEWIVSQDIHKAGGDYAWKVYIQRDARQMLSEMDRYF